MEAIFGFRGVENGGKEGWIGLGSLENEDNRGERNSPTVELRRPDLGASGVFRPGNFTAVVISSFQFFLAGSCNKMMAGKSSNDVDPVGAKTGRFDPVRGPRV